MTIRKVIIVEDNEQAAAVLTVALTQVGHVVRVANSGKAALDTARQFQPDVALIDIGLPDFDGFRLAHLMRATLVLGRCRMIAVTGRSNESKVARSIAAGFEAHLTKPVNVRALLEALAESD